MKKKFIILFFLLANFFFSYSQERKIYWNNSMLTISDITENSFVLNNNSDNTIKVKCFIKGKEDFQFILEGGSYKTIKHSDIDVFSESFFYNYSIKLYYDFDCFEHDMIKINKEAKQRANNAKERNSFKMLFRIVGLGMEKLGNSDWQKAGRNINSLLDIIEFGERVKSDGWDNAITYKIKDMIKGDPTSDAIDTYIKDKYINTAIHGLKTFYSYSNNSVYVDLRDLNSLINTLFNCISISNPIITYRIDYKETIEPVIDRDLDGITNINDKCPDEKGDIEFINDPEYKGCPKYYVLEQKSLARKRAIAKIIGYYNSYDFGSRWGKSSISLGYKHLVFLDTDYLMRVEEKMIQYSYGLNTNVSVNYYPIMIDLNVFYSKFTTNNLFFYSFSDYPDKRIYHYGLSGYLSVFPLPRLGGVTNYIMPYAGIGYETSSLSIKKKPIGSTESSESSTNTLASTPTSEIKWKVGTKIYLGRKYTLYGEYYSPINSDKETANKGWIVGFSLKM